MNGVELFAGPGGWSEGAQLDLIGIESNADACATARAAGHHRICTKLGPYGPEDFEQVFGRPAYKHSSPPCQGFTLNGKGRGREDGEALISAVLRAQHTPVADVIEGFTMLAADPRSALSLEPLRWIEYFRPRWVTLEQVTWMLRVWEGYATVLHHWGYHVVTGYVNAEQFGVGQTRKRAVLIADLEAPVAMPTPTHSKYHNRSPERMDPGVLPWVSFAEVVPWAGDPAEVEARMNNQTQQQWDYTWPKRRPALAITGMDKVPMPGDFNKRSRNDGVRITLAEAAALQGFRPDYPWHGGASSLRQQIGNAVPPPMSAAIVRTLGITHPHSPNHTTSRAS